MKNGKLAVEVLVDIEPTNAYENAGLIWYYDDDNYVIMVKEKIGKDILMQLVAEQDGKPKAGFHKKFNEGKSVWSQDGSGGGQDYRPLSGLAQG